LRYRYVVLAYSPGVVNDAASPIGVVYVALRPNEGRGALFVKDDWAETVREAHRDYLEDTFRDLADNLAEAYHPGVLSRVLNLSVGPLRAIHDDECADQQLDAISSRLLSANVIQVV
jgi:hypothetical protein